MRTKNLNLIFILYFLCLSAPLFSQKQIKEYKNRKEISINQIKKLRGGALLVRLKTKLKSIAALRERGDDELANKIEKSQKDLNKTIMEGFKGNFNFCPVYFFASENSISIIKNNIDSVLFLSRDLKGDPSIRPAEEYLLTIEFADLQQDTTTNPGKLVGMNALIIKNLYFVQLRDPFPYYTRTFDSIFFLSRSPAKTIRHMNKKLTSYYFTYYKNNTAE